MGALGDARRRNRLRPNELSTTGMSHTVDFLIKKEDHTLGNLITEHLKQAPHVLFAAYKGTATVSPSCLV